MTQNWGRRQAWENCGGAAPALASIDPFGSFTEADPSLGTSSIRTSSFGQVGKECFWSAKIQWGTSPSAGEGFYVLTGMPVAPIQNRAGGDGARRIGSGFVLDASDDYKRYTLDVVIDYGFDETRPIFLLHGDDTAGAQQSVGGTGTMFGSHNQPIAWATGDIINVSGQYEGV
jgi:hypothetical protein